jgi:hypothetical protein
MRVFGIVAAMACVFGAWPALAQDREPLRGDVVAVDGARLRVRSERAQDMTVMLREPLRISVRSPVAPDAIREGDFIGTTAALQPDGTLRASEVHIFPESMRGTGEGHRPMASVPGSTMTNATVARVASARTMTNATVAKRDARGGALTLELAYAGGEQTVVVPAGVPIMAVENGDRASLAPGAHVIVYASPGADSGLEASRITIEIKGSVPRSG